MDQLIALFPSWTWVKTASVYYAAWTVLWKFFHTRVQAYLTDLLARQAADPDFAEATMSVLSSRWYKNLAFAFNFLSFKLPTERDFKDQLAAKNPRPTAP